MEQVGILEILDKRQEAKVQKQLTKEFEAVRIASLGSHQETQVPYLTNIGVTVRTTENSQGSLHTGVSEGDRAGECNVVLVLSKEKNAMAHISPQTLNDDYLNYERRGLPTNHRVDLELSKVFNQTGSDGRVIIISGHDNLGYMLKHWLTLGQENPWEWVGDSQKPAESPHLSPQQVKVLALGMTPKEVLYTKDNLWIKDHSTHKITKIPSGLFPYSPDQ